MVDFDFDDDFDVNGDGVRERPAVDAQAVNVGCSRTPSTFTSMFTSPNKFRSTG